MKLVQKLTPVALATSMALGALAVPSMASAEVSYNAAVSSMYLWRGTDVSNGPAVSGGVDYNHDTGLYVGTWISSGLAASAGTAGGGYEVDVYAGYAGEVSGFGYDLSVWSINYPQFDGDDSGTEYALGLSYMDFSIGYVSGEDDYEYTTVGYSYDMFGITYGMSDDGAGAEYSHVDLSIAATDALTFTLSLPSDDTAGISEEELLVVSYSLPF